MSTEVQSHETVRPLDIAPRFASGFGLMAGVGLIFALPWWVMHSLRLGDYDGRVVAIHAAVVCIAGLRIARLVYRCYPRYLELVFYIFVYLWLGLAPLAQNLSDTFPLPNRYDDATLLRASVICGVGLIAFELGRLVKRGDPSPQAFSGARITWGVVLLLTLFSILTFVALVPRFGGLGPFFASRAALDEASAALQTDASSKALQGTYGALLSIPPLIGFVSYLTLARSKSVAMPGKLLVLPVLLGINVVVNNPISNARSWFAVCATAVLVTVVPAKPQRAFAPIAVALVIAVVFVFPLLGQFRYDDRNVNNRVDANSQYTSSGDYDAYQQIAAGVQHVQRQRYDLGKQLSGPALFFVPRRIWSDKPIDTGVMLAREQGYRYTNLSAPLWIEFYIAFGLFGVAIGFFGLGWLWRRLDDAYVRRALSGHASSLLLVGVPIVAVYQTAVLRGSLLTVTGRLAVIGLVLTALYVMSALTRPTRVDRKAPTE